MKLRSAIPAFIVVLALSCAAWSQGGQMPNLSADMKTHTAQGEDIPGKIFFSSDKHMRMEMSTRGHNVIIISDVSNPNEPKSITLMPEQHMYMEMSGKGLMKGMHQTPQVRMYDPRNPCSGMDGTTCKKVGIETVNGYACDKWEFSGELTQTTWISQQLHFPVKSVHKDGTSVEFTNIKEGAQDPALFKVPAGYQKFDMGAMMGGRSQE